MTTQKTDLDMFAKNKAWIIGSLGMILFVALAFWGGRPNGVSTAVFLGGVLILLMIIVGIGALGWHLLVRPLSTGHKTPALQLLPATYRHLLALLLITSGLAWIVGGFWDEVWHRTYGVPFGEDFFWRPHMLIYYSIGSVALLAAASFWFLLRHGRGTWQQRFRANPLLGLLVLLGSFMAFAIPADPIWHIIYSEDLTAWSIPHIVLIFSFVGTLLLAIATYQSGQERRSWGMVWQLRPSDWLVIAALSLMLNTLLQGMTTDWEGAPLTVLQSRPEWLLPATIVALATWVGTLANYSLRRIGSATAVGLVALIIRAVLRWGFAFEAITLSAWLCTLAPLLALDLWQAVRFGQKRPFGWLATGAAALVGMGLVSFPLINRFFIFPSIAANNLLGMLLACAVAAVGAAWVGQTVGDHFATHNKQISVEATAVASPLLRLASPLIILIMLGVVVIFVATATPPV